MKIDVKENTVVVEETGIKFLKLKTQVAQRIGSLMTSGKNAISFPVSSLPLLSDLLEDVVMRNPIVDNVFSRFKLHAKAREIVIKIMESSNQAVTLSGDWCHILDPAQTRAVAAMTVENLIGLCLFDEQGSGKTVMTIASFDILKQMNKTDGMVVVCPKTMVNEWHNGIEHFLPNKYKISVVEGTRQQKYEKSFQDFDVLITNYETIGTILVLLSTHASAKRILLVVDESFYLKNEETIRSEYITKFRQKCQKCFVLCGTPAPNSAHDLINQFDLADLGFTFGGFKKSKKQASDWDKIATLVDTKGVFIRRMKTEILAHVPEKSFHIIHIELSGKQALMYEQARMDLELKLRTFNNETFKRSLMTYFQRRAVLLQICSCPTMVDPIFSETPVKYPILDTLLKRLTAQKRKVIIWSSYKHSLDEIEKRYSEYNPVRIDGTVSSDLRRNAVRRFQENPETMLFIGNPAAAGAGITLHAAHDAVFFSYPDQAAHYLQALDRIHRRGQISDNVNYYLLICKGTIEETEIIRLREKEIQQHTLLGDHTQWPASIDEALKELESYG